MVVMVVVTDGDDEDNGVHVNRVGPTPGGVDRLTTSLPRRGPRIKRQRGYNGLNKEPRVQDSRGYPSTRGRYASQPELTLHNVRCPSNRPRSALRSAIKLVATQVGL